MTTQLTRTIVVIHAAVVSVDIAAEATEVGALAVDLDTDIVVVGVVTVAAAHITMENEDITPAQEAVTDRTAVPSLQGDTTTPVIDLGRLPWLWPSSQGVGALAPVPGLDHLVIITGAALTRTPGRPRWWLRLCLCKTPFRLPYLVHTSKTDTIRTGQILTEGIT